MSELTASRQNRQSGRPLVWLLTLLSVLLLGYVTSAAVRHNPLYSDADTYGISKYRFIESCKETLHDAGDLTLSLQGQSIKLGDLVKSSGQLHGNETLLVKSTGTSAELVSGVRPVDADKLGLIAPVSIVATSSEGERPLGQASMQCLHDKATGKTDVHLAVAQ